jgi:hypothetical protein
LRALMNVRCFKPREYFSFNSIREDGLILMNK